MSLVPLAPTLEVQLDAYTVSACWRSELGWDMSSRYLAWVAKL